MNVKVITAAVVAFLLAASAASAEPVFYWRSAHSGVLAMPKPSGPGPKEPEPAACSNLPTSGLVSLPGFATADWRFAASYLGCSLPAVAGTVAMENSGGYLLGRKQVSTVLVVSSCGAEAAEFQRSFSMFAEGRTIMFFAATSALARGKHGVTVTCTLESSAQPGIPVSVMLMPIELVVP